MLLRLTTGIILLGVTFFLFSPIGYLLYPCLVIGFIVLSHLFLSNHKIIKYNKAAIRSTFIIITLLFLFMILSSVISMDMEGFGKALLFTMILFFLVLVYPFVNVDYNFKLQSIRSSCLYIISGVIVLSFLLERPSLAAIIFGYQGLFDNPNKFGYISALIASILGGELVLSFFRREKSTILKAILFFLSLLCVILSASRTSLISVLIVVFLVFIIELRKIKNIEYKIKISFLIVASFLVILTIFWYSGLLEIFILSKFKSKQEGSDMYSGRTEMWQIAVDYSKVLSKNHIFASKFELGVHNTYLAYMINYGYIVFLLFVLFFLKMFLSAIKFAIRSCSDLRFLPLVIIGSTVFIAMSEQIFTSINCFASLMCFGVIVQYNNLNKIKNI